MTFSILCLIFVIRFVSIGSLFVDFKSKVVNFIYVGFFKVIFLAGIFYRLAGIGFFSYFCNYNRMKKRMDIEKHKVLPVKDIIRLCVERNVSFFAYRLPEEAGITIGIQTSDNRYSVDFWEEQRAFGFVFSPFVKSKGCADRFIKADIWLSDEFAENFSMTELQEIVPVFPNTLISADVRIAEESEDNYLQTVEKLIIRMQANEFQKVVYARQIIQPSCRRESLSDIFEALLEVYPDAFVSLVHLAGEETWVGASPEVLLSNTLDNGFKTIALAGTKPIGETVWGYKETEEQEMVRRYVEKVLADQKITVKQSETYTQQAGNVSHLCTSFIREKALPLSRIKDIVPALHPTPAVCGLPKEKSLQVILDSEPFDRRYYAGYLGPVSSEGIRLFVNLRCIRLSAQDAAVYVGGGITKDSVPSDEWDETCLKAQVLLRIIENCTK